MMISDARTLLQLMRGMPPSRDPAARLEMFYAPQAASYDRFRERMGEVLGGPVHLRKASGLWPPLHTSIMWERNIPNRGAMLMHAMPGGFQAPKPPVLSLVKTALATSSRRVRLFYANRDHDAVMFRSEIEALEARYGERFRRVWHFWLMASAANFRARKTQLWQIVLSPKGVAGGYHAVR